jgi:hypothetical protein
MQIVTLPPEVTAQIRDFCTSIRPSGEPRYVPIEACADALPKECFGNVRQRVSLHGGQIVFGWAIWIWPRVFVEAEHHAIYERPDGTWIDVTPQSNHDQILFLPDDSAVYDFDNPQRRDNLRLALKADPLIESYFEWFRGRKMFEDLFPGTNQVTLKGKAAQDFKAFAKRGIEIEQQLVMKYYPAMSPCPCGSTRAFWYCHGGHGSSSRQSYFV